MSSLPTPQELPISVLFVTRDIQIPLSEFEFLYSRASGPGGQNVNKVSSRVQLRWPFITSDAVPDEVKLRLRSLAGSRISGDGVLLVTSQRFRDQPRNREDCLEKLRELVAAAAVRPTVRRPTKASRGSKERRLKAKRQRSARKEQRRGPAADD